ncbi:hypothetical protein CYMTET_19324 [Cymbomonas tetramitiformis]|uniref:Uncharacterized protein n=1 Tax=Cymbomonas tetramitiformis TaxID=36881 RepID=A0AAE0G7M2_9CHLO|nr:hypothetical protein CYMTET_19324 [Cymbomonas tetramitiformis]
MVSNRRSPRPVVESIRSARAAAAASGTPAGSALPGSAAPSPQRGSRTPGQDPDPVVRMSALISRPTFISLAATSADFHRDASVWESTPVRASQQYEYSERMDYAFTYGEELVKVLRSHGFKPQKGYTFDVPDSETDFAVLLGNLRHVLSPISHNEYDKLFDLEHEYLEYHWSPNELIFIILKGVLNGTALALYQESARVHPRDGRCALQRLRYHVEASTDPDTFRFWTKLRDTNGYYPNSKSYHKDPRANVFSSHKHHLIGSTSRFSASWATNINAFIPAMTTLDVYKIYSTSSADRGAPLPPSHSSIFGRWWWQGTGGRSRWCCVQFRTHTRRHRPIVKPVGDWKPAQNPRVPHLMWEGVGYPCVSCFRIWGVTDGHLATEGVCPYACAASFAPSRAPPDAPTAPKRPTVAAWAQPAGGVPPAAAPGPPASRGSPSLQHAAVDGDGDDDPAAFPFRPFLLDRDEPGPMPDTSVDDGDADWPALRSVPWIPPFQGASTSRSAAKQD